LVAHQASVPNPLVPHSDLALARAAKARDRKALAGIVKLLSDPLTRYIRSRLWPRTDAVDDLVQDVFLALWQNLDRYEGSSPLRTWALGIARHKVEDYYRENLRRFISSSSDEEDSVAVQIEDTSVPVDEWMAKEESARLAWDVLRTLPEDYAMVLQWKYWEQRSAAHMANALGRTEKSVERLLARARAKFREEWTARGRRETTK
jgi:RNA polymerase sigma-70 factor, ECF subfamily